MQQLILLVDNDREEFFFYKHAIQMAALSCQCVWASDDKRAEQLLQHVIPDFIMIDCNLPTANGITCLQKIRKMSRLQKAQIVMYSPFISNTTRKLALMEGATCMQQPASLSKLAKYLINLSGEGKALSNL